MDGTCVGPDVKAGESCFGWAVQGTTLHLHSFSRGFTCVGEALQEQEECPPQTL